MKYQGSISNTDAYKTVPNTHTHTRGNDREEHTVLVVCGGDASSVLKDNSKQANTMTGGTEVSTKYCFACKTRSYDYITASFVRQKAVVY
eukprot:148618-Amphidinium_carterae.1